MAKKGKKKTVKQWVQEKARKMVGKEPTPEQVKKSPFNARGAMSQVRKRQKYLDSIK